MTQDEIISMAREAGLDHYLTIRDFPKQLERFAAIVAAHTKNEIKRTSITMLQDGEAAVLAEREACAKVCDEEAEAWARLNAQDEEGYGATQCAAAIRSRGVK